MDAPVMAPMDDTANEYEPLKNDLTRYINVLLLDVEGAASKLNGILKFPTKRDVGHDELFQTVYAELTELYHITESVLGDELATKYVDWDDGISNRSHKGDLVKAMVRFIRLARKKLTDVGVVDIRTVPLEKFPMEFYDSFLNE